MNDLNGKCVIVTGAARGIGQEYAVSLASLGANVVAADLNDCAETVKRAEEQPGTVIGTTLNVTDLAQAEAAVALALSRFDRLDGLINNAALYGTLKGGRFDTLSEADWDAAMDVNVKGIWNCCRAAVPAMRKIGAGSIINIASLAGSYGTPYVLHYTTSKAAVSGMTRGLARELGRDKIRVNAIAPSAVLTEATNDFFADKTDVALKTIRSMQSIAENLQPSDLVGTANWLLSDASAFITGQTIAVDGGTMM
ncbi:SDR family NAD(P)-dependent oxidoreductase [Roseovarius sp.]|uniref:SDR family NAD(P)-dependent oxidoreductase n=1 Tax=Roseovarius sp. TaxID=1486281 RepID=UPI003A978F31